MLESSKDLLGVLKRFERSLKSKQLTLKDATAQLQDFDQLVGNKEEFPEIAFLQHQISLASKWNVKIINAINIAIVSTEKEIVQDQPTIQSIR